jgi:predicted PurR-regulated permease PerM
MSVPAPPRLPTGERLRRAGIASWSLIGIIICVGIFFYLLLKIRIVFPPLVLALLIIYMLNPLVARLEQRGVPRVAGTFLAFTVFLGTVTLVLLATIPYVADQVEDFSDDWPKFRGKTIEFVDDTAASLERTFGFDVNVTQIDCLLGADDTTDPDAPSTARCDEVTERLRKRVVEGAGNFTEIGRSVLEVILVFILGPLIALYLLVDLPDLQRDLLNLVPPAHREEARDLGGKVGRAVGGFFRGQLMVAIFVGVLSALGFRIIGLPFWFVIGGIAGFFNLVPLIGPFIGGGIGFLVGTVSGGIGLGLKAAIVELIVQQLDNHILSPNVMRRTVQLHPTTVMLALLAGGALFGFWGVLLGVPGVAVTKILLNHVWSTRVLGVQPTPFVPPQTPEPAAEVSADAVIGAHEDEPEDPEGPSPSGAR